jgi:hypothetical protein
MCTRFVISLADSVIGCSNHRQNRRTARKLNTVSGELEYGLKSAAPDVVEHLHDNRSSRLTDSGGR